MTMDIVKLRKKDFATSLLVLLGGVAVTIGATQMPMTDSWGGVQNVWYVSPALFPLFVGCMLVLLGLVLMYNALREIGLSGVREVGTLLKAPLARQFWTEPANVRFFAILLVFFSFVFLMIPRVDFFLAATFFLLSFMLMFYPQQHSLLLQFAAAYLIAIGLIGLSLLIGGTDSNLADWTTLVLVPIYAFYARSRMQFEPLMARRFRITLLIAIIVPFIVCPIFKYMLLVPLPYEGLVVSLMDAIRYQDF